MAKGDKKLKKSKSAEKDSPKNQTNNKRKNGRGDEAGPSSKRNKNYAIVDDERFQSVHYDPIFQNIPKKESKVEVDSRFDRMFTDESFGNRSRAKIDKRGKIKEKTESHLTRYYVEEKEKKKKMKKKKGVVEEEEKIENEERESEEEEERESMEEEEIESEEEESESTELEESSSSDDDDDDYADFEDQDEDMIKNDITQYLLANQGNVTTTNEETNRLAIVNMDWDNIKAADLYVVLSSCLPSGGQILSVSIYPTEIGLKCMEIEATKGPSVLLNGNEDNNNDESDSEDDSEENEKLRSYELNKLSYYHGVAVFDSSTTANHVYEFLDGTEFLSTANVFDLRFIPDSMEFKHPPRDVATEEPASYSAPDFETRALQHSDVKLTWEEDDRKRTKTLRRKFNPDELDELNEYLASSEDDSDADVSEDENGASGDGNENEIGKSSKKRRDGGKYRELLLSGDKSNSDEDEVGDMEVTFKPELEEINKRILEKKNKKPETVWEQLCQKNREKKEARRNRSKNASSDDDSTDDDNTQDRENMEHDDFFIEDEPIKSVKSDRKVREESSDLDEKERGASRAELELLVADDNNDNVKGYKLKRKKVKGKKGKLDEVESKLPDVDPSKDPRFSALFTSHLYALDPTDPQYKRTPAYARQQSDKKNKTKNPQVSTNEKEPLNIETPMNDDDTKPIDKEKYELSSAIKSIKKNLKNIKKSTKNKSECQMTQILLATKYFSSCDL